MTIRRIPPCSAGFQHVCFESVSFSGSVSNRTRKTNPGDALLYLVYFCIYFPIWGSWEGGAGVRPPKSSAFRFLKSPRKGVDAPPPESPMTRVTRLASSSSVSKIPGSTSRKLRTRGARPSCNWADTRDVSAGKTKLGLGGGRVFSLQSGKEKIPKKTGGMGFKSTM